MQKTIKQLYDGEIYPNEQLKVNIKGYRSAKNIAFEAHEVFEGKLCQAMKEELDEFLSKHSNVTCIEQTQIFIDGFKLGARLMLEILEEDRT